MKKGDTEIIAGMEIGSAKVMVVIGQIFPDGVINIIGKGEAVSHGVDKGVVTDLNALSESIKSAVRIAEDMADCELKSVLLSISGAHIECRNESGMCIVGSTEITEYHIDEAIQTAKSLKLTDNKQLLHAIAQDYVIDGRADVKNPKGLSAGRLSAHVHLVTCDVDMIKNMSKAVEKSGLAVDQFVFSGLASSYAVVTEDEKELGVCLVDFGAGTMDVSIYTNGYLRYSMALPYGGNLITNDIARGLSTSKQDAELLKIKFGAALKTTDLSDEVIEIHGLGGRADRSIDKNTLVEIIEARYAELFQFLKMKIAQVQSELKAQKMDCDINAGIILTGGAAQIQNAMVCARKELGMDVRIGAPQNIEGLTDCVCAPVCSTSVGLLHYYQKEMFNSCNVTKKDHFIISGFKKLMNFVRKEL